MSKKEKKYIATIVRKYPLGNECYLLSLDHISVGELDETTQIFTDKEGNCFAPMSNQWMITSEVPYLYDSIITMESMKEAAKNSESSLKMAMKVYEEMCRKTLYLVGKGTDGTTFSTTLNTDQLKGQVVEKLEEQGLKDDGSGAITIDNLQQLIQDIDNGKYSSDDVQNIVEELKLTKEDLESVIDYIELQKEEEKENSIMEEPLDVTNAVQTIRKTLIAQDEAIVRVVSELARKRIDNRERTEGILLTGASGVGKTKLMELIARHTNIPVYRIDVSQLAPSGYTGCIEEELWKLYEACGRDIQKTENAILFFDHIDDWLNGNENVSLDVMGIPLRIMDGEMMKACQDVTNAQKVIDLNTKNMIVVLGGTYTNRNTLGFIENPSNKKQNKVTMKTFIEKGRIPQDFMGRVTVVKMNDLDVNDLKRILIESDESATHVQTEIFHKLGVKITFTDSYITSVAENATKEEIGARSLKGMVNEDTWKAFYEVQCNPSEYQEVIIQDSEHIQYVKKRK